jgi:RimJ/RimL family protein N-acetyltransferase
MMPDKKGQGLGYLVWEAMMLYAKNSGCFNIKTTIAAANLPVTNLYMKLGFRFSAPEMTLHWVRA